MADKPADPKPVDPNDPHRPVTAAPPNVSEPTPLTSPRVDPPKPPVNQPTKPIVPTKQDTGPVSPDRRTDERDRALPAMPTGGILTRGTGLFAFIADLRAVSKDITDRNWPQLATDLGNLLVHFGGAMSGNVSTLNTVAANDPPAGYDSREADQKAREEFESAVAEYEKAKAFGFQAIHQLPQDGWHRAGGPVSGAAPGMAAQAAAPAQGLFMTGGWLALLLEIAPVVIDAIRKNLGNQKP